MLTLNIEADVSQNINKRLLFQQTLTSDNSRLLVLNDTYIKDAKAILDKNNFKNRVIFCDNSNKNELLLSSNILDDPFYRKCLVDGYCALPSVQSTGRNAFYVDGFLILLNAVSKINKELPLFTLGSWQTMDNDDLLNELNSIDIESIPKNEQILVNALMKTWKKSAQGIKAFKSFSKSIWKIHSGLMVNGNIKPPAEWLDKNMLLILSTSGTESGFGKVLLTFALKADIELYIDSLLNPQVYLSNIVNFKSKVFISRQSKQYSHLSDLGYLANDLYCSTQSFNSELFVSWLVRNHPKLIQTYSLDDFNTVFCKYQFGSYVNAFIGANDSSLLLCRLTDKNEFVTRDLDLEIILTQIRKAQSIPDTKVDLNGLIDELKESISSIATQISELKNTPGTNEMVDESEAIDRLFEKSLLAQRANRTDNTSD